MNEVGELLRGFALSDPAKGAGEHQIGETCHSLHTATHKFKKKITSQSSDKYHRKFTIFEWLARGGLESVLEDVASSFAGCSG